MLDWNRIIAVGGEKKLLWVLCVLLLVLVYFPVVTTEYGFYDDYYYLNLADADSPARELFNIGARQGRPLTGLAFATSMGQIEYVSELSYLRVIGVGFTALFGASLFWLLVRFGWSYGSSLLAALLVALLPSFQVYVSWSVCFLLPAAALLGLLAGYHWTQYWQGRVLLEWKASLKHLIVAALAVALAMAIYQPAAMIIWLFPAIFLLFGEKAARDEFRFFIATGIFVGCALGFGFLLLKTGVFLLGAHGDARSGLLTDVMEKAFWFFDEPVRSVMIPWQLETQSWQALASLAFILVGFYGFNDRNWSGALRKLIWLLVLLILAYLPNLLSAENWASFRTQIAIGAVMAIAIAGSLEGWRRLIKDSSRWVAVGGFCMFVVVALSAQQNVVRGFVIPQSTEWSWLKGQVREAVTEDELRPIRAVGSNWQYSVAEKVYYDEFGLPSSAQPWMPVPMVRLAIKSIGLEPDRFEIIGVDPSEVELTEEDSFYQIDFRRIVKLR